MKTFSFFVVASIFILFCSTSVIGSPSKGAETQDTIPNNIKQNRHGNYKNIDDLINDFRLAGANVREFEGGNVIHIPIKVTGRQYFSNLNLAAEKTCLYMRGKQGRPERGDNLRRGWYFLFFSGHPIVNFDEEVEAAERMIRASLPVDNKHWLGPSSEGYSDDFLCNTYETRVVPDYEQEKLLNPLFVLSKRCEFESPIKSANSNTNMCHWFVIKTPFLLNKLKSTRADAEQHIARTKFTLNENLKKKEKAYDDWLMQKKSSPEKRTSSLALTKTTGTKICTAFIGSAQESTGILVFGKPQYEKYDGGISIVGFTEGANAERVQIRVGALNFDSIDSFPPKSLRLEKTDYQNISIKEGAVFWDDAINWIPC